MDTGYTHLAGKRLEMLRTLMPEVSSVALINMPEIAPRLGVNALVFDVGSEQSFAAVANDIAASDADVLFLVPASPVQQAMKEQIAPRLLDAGIPIFGVFSSDLERGAFAFYGGDQYLMGRQSARLVDEVLNGTLPADIPIETPVELHLIVNRSIVDMFGVILSDNAWALATNVIELPIDLR